MNNNTGYRFGDIVLNYPCEREKYKNLLKLQSKKFPNSIGIKYTKLYKEELPFQDKLIVVLNILNYIKKNYHFKIN